MAGKRKYAEELSHTRSKMSRRAQEGKQLAPLARDLVLEGGQGDLLNKIAGYLSERDQENWRRVSKSFKAASSDEACEAAVREGRCHEVWDECPTRCLNACKANILPKTNRLLHNNDFYFGHFDEDKKTFTVDENKDSNSFLNTPYLLSCGDPPAHISRDNPHQSPEHMQFKKILIDSVSTWIDPSLDPLEGRPIDICQTVKAMKCDNPRLYVATRSHSPRWNAVLIGGQVYPRAGVIGGRDVFYIN